MNDQESFELGYLRGLRGDKVNVSVDLTGYSRFAYIRGWIKGWKEYAATLPPRVIALW